MSEPWKNVTDTADLAIAHAKAIHGNTDERLRLLEAETEMLTKRVDELEFQNGRFVFLLIAFGLITISAVLILLIHIIS